VLDAPRPARETWQDEERPPPPKGDSLAEVSLGAEEGSQDEPRPDIAVPARSKGAPAAPTLDPMMAAEVVMKTGAKVRQEVDLASPELSKRLAYGALVKVLAQEGMRVRFLKLTGEGPDTGWVSSSINNGKALLVESGRTVEEVEASVREKVQAEKQERALLQRRDERPDDKRRESVSSQALRQEFMEARRKREEEESLRLQRQQEKVQREEEQRHLDAHEEQERREREQRRQKLEEELERRALHQRGLELEEGRADADDALLQRMEELREEGRQKVRQQMDEDLGGSAQKRTSEEQEETRRRGEQILAAEREASKRLEIRLQWAAQQEKLAITDRESTEQERQAKYELVRRRKAPESIWVYVSPFGQRGRRCTPSAASVPRTGTRQSRSRSPGTGSSGLECRLLSSGRSSSTSSGGTAGSQWQTGRSPGRVSSMTGAEFSKAKARSRLLGSTRTCSLW